MSLNNPTVNQINADHLFHGERRLELESVYNAGGSPLVIPLGTILGRATSGGANGYLTVCKSGSSDGSQIPLYIMPYTVTVPATSALSCQIAINGIVDSSLLVFDGTDTLTTQVSGGLTFDDYLNQRFKLNNYQSNIAFQES